jgi:hypothetical protein
LFRLALEDRIHCGNLRQVRGLGNSQPIP